MEVEFTDPDLDQLELDPRQDAGLPESVVRSYRRAMQWIRAASDERDIRARKGFHFEKLKGNRKHQHSLRLNDQFRLIVEFRGQGAKKTVVIVAVEDYH